MKRRVFLTAFLTALAGCAASEDSSVSGEKIGKVGSHNVHRYIDREAGLVIYVSDGYKAGGISVVPISNTNLS